MSLNLWLYDPIRAYFLPFAGAKLILLFQLCKKKTNFFHFAGHFSSAQNDAFILKKFTKLHFLCEKCTFWQKNLTKCCTIQKKYLPLQPKIANLMPLRLPSRVAFVV